MMNRKTKSVLLVTMVMAVAFIEMYLPGSLIFLALLFGLLILPILAILSIIVIGASMVRRDIREASKSAAENIVIST